MLSSDSASADQLHQRIMETFRTMSSKGARLVPTARKPDPNESLHALFRVWVMSVVGRDYNDEPDPDRAIHLRQEYKQRVVAYGATAVELLLDLCQHEDWLMRSEVAEALGEIGDVQAIPTLLDLMHHDDSLSVQISAASALDKLGNAAVISQVDTWYREQGIRRAQPKTEIQAVPGLWPKRRKE